MDPEHVTFPVVGIGASAGGLAALRELLRFLPADAGMAYMVVQHLDPTHESLLPTLLARATRMGVHEAREEMEVSANQVYVIPPNMDLMLAQNVLQLMPRTQEGGQHLFINTFLRSLAESRAALAMGVILSGTATDGTLGLQAIKTEGGMTFALRVQRANQAFYQLFQAAPAETERRRIYKMGNGQWNLPALRTLLEELLPTNHAFTDYELDYTFPNIGHRVMILKAQHIDGSQLILLAFEDITERQQAANAKQQMLTQREAFMAIASHELKTPVTSLKGYTQVLQARFAKAGDERAADLLAKMDVQLDKLIHLISELLDVTRLEAGQLFWNTRSFDLDTLVREIVEEVGYTTQRHQIRIEGDHSVPVFTDRERTGQVLTNLLSNAILVKCTSDTENGIVSVQDFGIGIASEKLAHVFERFYRVSDREHETFPGLGLGLFISAEIVKRQGGRMWVESQPGVSSTFSFTVPLASPPEPTTLVQEREE